MYRVDVYLRVRRAVMMEGMSVREASRVFGLHLDTVRKMLAYSVPPGYRRTSPPRRPKLEPFTGVIDAILEGDRKVPKKQRHTAKRIFERLRDEYGFTGQYTIVKDYVRERRRRGQEMFVPLSHAPGHAQCDFGEAMAVIGDRGCGAQGALLRAGPASQRRLFRKGLSRGDHRGLSGRPRVRVCLPWRCAPERPVRQYQAGSGSELGDGRRRRTRAFTELESHYLFEDRFGRPGKGKVEGMVGYVRRNFLVPIPSFESFQALNAHLEQRCLERMDAVLRGHSETIGQRMERDLDALLALPLAPYDACDKQSSRVSSLSLVRYRTNEYSVPVAYGHRDVLIRGYVDEVVISCGAEVIAPAFPLLRERRLCLRPHPLPAAFGAEDGRAGSGRAAAGVGTARGVSDAAASAGGAHGPAGKAGIRAGATPDGAFLPPGSPSRRQGCPPAGRTQL